MARNSASACGSTGGNGEIAVRALVEPERAQPCHGLAGAIWHTHRVEQVEWLDRHQRGERAYHRRVHALADAREAHVLQRAEDADDRAQRRDAVAERRSKADGWVRLLAAGQHDAAERLGDRVGGTTRAQLAGDAEAGQGCPDDARVGIEHEVEVESEFVERAARKVVDDHVGTRDQVMQHLPRARLFQVERDARACCDDASDRPSTDRLGSSGPDSGPLGPQKRWRGASFAGRILHADHPRAQARQQHRREWPSEGDGHVQDG